MTIENTVLGTVAETLDLEAEVLAACADASMPLDAFGLDSLGMVRVAMDLENRFGIEIEAPVLDHIETFGDLFSLVRALGAQDPGTAAIAAE